MPNDLVSPSELSTYMSGLDLDVPEEDAAQTVLDGLVDELERYCNRPLAAVERTEVLHPDAEGRVWPSATPILSVSAPLGAWILGNYLGGCGWGPLTVTYIGGIDGQAGDAIRLAVLRAASREMTIRHDDTLTVKDLDARDVAVTDRRDPGFTDAELKKFDRIRRRTAV